MTKNEKRDMEPISLSVYQQMVFDRAADLMSMAEVGNIKAVIERLIDMSNYPIKAPTVKVIIENGVIQDVLSDAPVALEVIAIDDDYNDCNKLQEYRKKLYKDKRLTSIEYGSANFEEDS